MYRAAGTMRASPPTCRRATWVSRAVAGVASAAAAISAADNNLTLVIFFSGI